MLSLVLEAWTSRSAEKQYWGLVWLCPGSAGMLERQDNTLVKINVLQRWAGFCPVNAFLVWCPSSLSFIVLTEPLSALVPKSGLVWHGTSIASWWLFPQGPVMSWERTQCRCLLLIQTYAIMVSQRGHYLTQEEFVQMQLKFTCL